jgi:hypothetical protein
MTNPDAELTGQLHVYVAFDWGEEVNLEQAGRLVPGAAVALSRRPRTPTSFDFRPPPLRFRLTPAESVDEDHATPAAIPSPFCLADRKALPIQSAEATVFDFAAVSVALNVPFRLTPDEVVALAGRLVEPDTAARIVSCARAAVEPLYHKLLPAIQRPFWPDNLWEEYFVFHFPPGAPLKPTVLEERPAWLAGLVRLEDQPLSGDEVAEAVRLFLRYGPNDLFVADWAAAFLLDHGPESDETLQTIEFANLQLLEYRHIDDRLDGSLARAYRLIHEAAHGRLRFWRGHHAPLRLLGELKVEANGLFERTGNVLKLVGDQYLARVYRLLATRFHLGEWERSIQRKLDVIEGVYQVLADQGATFRTEFLELIVIALIFLEIVLAIVRH